MQFEISGQHIRLRFREFLIAVSAGSHVFCLDLAGINSQYFDVRRKTSSILNIPKWGFVVIMSVLLLIVGAIVFLEGTIPRLFAQWGQQKIQTKTAHVELDHKTSYWSIISSQALVIITKSKFLVQRADWGFISEHDEEYFQSCIKACEQVSEQVRKIPNNDPVISEARAHLVEMVIAFEKMVDCFDEQREDRLRYRPIPKSNKIRFSIAANSVIENYKRLLLKIPET